MIEPVAKLSAPEKSKILSQFAGAAKQPDPGRRGHTQESRTRRPGGEMAQKGDFAGAESFVTGSIGKFTFLGTGASTGVPIIGCKCAVCSSNSLRNKRLRPSGLMQVGGVSILIDAGPDFRQQALTLKIDRLDGVLLTHTHFDHIAGIDDLRTYYLYQKAPLPCLLSDESFEEMQFRYHYLMKPVEKSHSLPAQLDFRVLEGDRGEVDFLGVKIGYFNYFQGNMKVTGYKAGDLAYVSDIREYDEAIFNWLSDVRTLVVSAIRQDVSKTLFSIGEAIEFGKRAGAKKVFLTHMNHEIDYDAVSRQLPSGVELAYDGLGVEFGI